MLTLNPVKTQLHKFSLEFYSANAGRMKREQYGGPRTLVKQGNVQRFNGNNQVITCTFTHRVSDLLFFPHHLGYYLGFQ